MEVKIMASTADADAQPPTLSANAAAHATIIGSTTTTTETATAGSLAAPAAMSAVCAVKTLKRCLSVPIIHTLPGTSTSAATTPTMTTRSAAKLHATANSGGSAAKASESVHDTPKKYNHNSHALAPDSSTSSIHIGIPRSSPSSREVSPAPVFNIFGPRTRRYSASYSPLGAAANAGSGAAMGAGTAPLCITPRVSQLRQEECVDMNSREVNHEREVHSAMQMSQSWEDLTLVAENWSCKSDEFSNPLQVVVLPSGVSSCSSPSPTNNRAGSGAGGSVRLPYGLSPSPTRRTFATRRSMSPIAMRPSQLGPVKRKFEMDDNSSNWNVYSPPPLKKIFTDSRGSSPVCQSPSSVCPSPPDSASYDGRITPKLFISKLCTTNTTTTNNNSACSSPMSSSPSSTTTGAIDGSTGASSTSCYSSASSSSASSSISGGSEPMCVGSSIDEGILISRNGEEKTASNRISSSTTAAAAANAHTIRPMSTSDLQDDATLMDDMKSETSSIGCCSSISVDSSCCDSIKQTPVSTTSTFLNKLSGDEAGTVTPFGQKNFFMNKQAKKFIVNHDNLPNSSNSCSSSSSGGEHADSCSIKMAKRSTVGGPADTTAVVDGANRSKLQMEL